MFDESLNVSQVNALTVSKILCVGGTFLSFLTMSGNLLVITSIIYFKQLHTPTNYLILSLAVTDLLVGTLVMPFSMILSLSSHRDLQDLLCKVRASLDMFLSGSSILNLCSISMDRFYAVCRPLSYGLRINVRVTRIMILSTWTLSALTGFGITYQAPGQGHLYGKCVVFQNKSRMSMLMGVLAGFYIPAVIIVSVYLKILAVAQGQARSILTTSKCGPAVSKMERKATKTLSIVMGIFFVSWTPFFLCITVQPLSNYGVPYHVIETFKWLGWSNSMLNPFVYAFFYSWFRSALRMIITGKLFRGDFSDSKLF